MPLASTETILPSIRRATRYISSAILTAPSLGAGNGPLNHFHSTYSLPFSAGNFVSYLLEHPSVAPHWHRHTNHPFLSALASDSLPLENFRYYLVQDYLYLIQFARANALAGYKASSLEEVSAAAKIVQHIERETALHIDFCREFGVSKDQMEAAEEDTACTAYTRYVLDVGMQGDLTGLQVALAPCLLGYGEIAVRLIDEAAASRRDGANDGGRAKPRFWKWVETYAAEDYRQAVATGRDLLERMALGLGPRRVEQLVEIFKHATRMEVGFWDMAMKAGGGDGGGGD